jgi:hypothetical protein
MESKHLKEILATLPAKFGRLFRNNVGLFWQGQTVAGGAHNEPAGTTVTLRNPRHVRCGLAPGSSDLIGWHTVEITPEMVGRKVAVFVGVEVKTGSTATTDEQAAWAKAVTDAGGVAIVYKAGNPATVAECVAALFAMPADVAPNAAAPNPAPKKRGRKPKPTLLTDETEEIV